MEPAQTRLQSSQHSSCSLVDLEPEKDAMKVHASAIETIACDTSTITPSNSCTTKESRQLLGGGAPQKVFLPPRIITPNTTCRAAFGSRTFSKPEQRQHTNNSHSYMHERRMSGLMGNTAISQSLQDIEVDQAVHELRLDMREEL